MCLYRTADGAKYILYMKHSSSPIMVPRPYATISQVGRTTTSEKNKILDHCG